ncbi:MAG: hypothetical protein ACP5JG_16150 [Anaerolineae bacterium]
MDDQNKQYAVRAVRCDHRADDDTVYEALKRATAPLSRVWRRLRRANTIATKFNVMFFKFVDPEEREAEHYEVYQNVLDYIEAKGLSG